MFRLTKSVRGVKLLNVFFLGLDFLKEIVNLLSKIYYTLPLFFKLLNMLLITVYIFTVVGVEMFTQENESNPVPNVF